MDRSGNKIYLFLIGSTPKFTGEIQTKSEKNGKQSDKLIDHPPPKKKGWDSHVYIIPNSSQFQESRDQNRHNTYWLRGQ